MGMREGAACSAPVQRWGRAERVLHHIFMWASVHSLELHYGTKAAENVFKEQVNKKTNGLFIDHGNNVKSFIWACWRTMKGHGTNSSIYIVICVQLFCNVLHYLSIYTCSCYMHIVTLTERRQNQYAQARFQMRLLFQHYVVYAFHFE